MTATRKSYTTKKKLTIIKELCVPNAEGELPSLRSVARKHNITTKMLRDWKMKKHKMSEILKDPNMQVRIVRKIGSGRKPKYPIIEQHLFDWAKEQKSNGIVVKNKCLKEKALQLATIHLSSDEKFTASEGFLSNFRKRHNLKLTSSRKSLEKVKEKMEKIECVEKIIYPITHSI